MFKYILWDIDRTILDFDKAETMAIRKCFTMFGLGTCSDEELKDYKKFNDYYWAKLEKGEIKKSEVLVNRFRDLFEKYGHDLDIIEDFNHSYQISLGEFAYFMPNARKVLEHFKGRIGQYAASNGTALAQRGKIKNSGLDKILDGFYISEDLGFEKPSIGFFEEIFEDLKDENRDNYVIVGDSLTSDIQGGINAGIKTIWYNPRGKENKNKLKVDYEIKDLLELIDIVEN